MSLIGWSREREPDRLQCFGLAKEALGSLSCKIPQDEGDIGLQV